MTLALYVLTTQSEYLVTGESYESLFEQLKSDFIEFDENFRLIERIFAIDNNVQSDAVEFYINERIDQEVGI